MKKSYKKLIKISRKAEECTNRKEAQLLIKKASKWHQKINLHE
tara:strand:- start:1739 stop:1867 length:129 start_codon:yes stop_codon:yes gene_type:complete